jgi:hypothetical protein
MKKMHRRAEVGQKSGRNAAPGQVFKIALGMIIRRTGRLCVAAYFDAGDFIPGRRT